MLEAARSSSSEWTGVLTRHRPGADLALISEIGDARTVVTGRGGVAGHTYPACVQPIVAAVDGLAIADGLETHEAGHRRKVERATGVDRLARQDRVDPSPSTDGRAQTIDEVLGSVDTQAERSAFIEQQPPRWTAH